MIFLYIYIYIYCLYIMYICTICIVLYIAYIHKSCIIFTYKYQVLLYETIAQRYAQRSSQVEALQEAVLDDSFQAALGAIVSMEFSHELMRNIIDLSDL